MKKIACYKIDDIDEAVLRTILKPMKIELVILDDGMLKMSIQAMLEQPELISNQDCTRFNESFMILNEVSDEELTQLLNQGEATAWTYQPIKMMVTQHNRSWKLESLFQEVLKEHQLFAKAGSLQQMLRETLQTVPEQVDKLALNQYNEALMKGYMLLKSGQFDDSSLDEAIALIQQSENNLKK